jgi:predicted metalloendopeptidase
LYLKENKTGLIDGFTAEQRFFISWATFGELNHVEAIKKTK